MARPDQEKCRLCSKLSVKEAKQRHGTMGDCCWDGLIATTAALITVTEECVITIATSNVINDKSSPL
jgi:hypothetical protein